MEKKYVRPSMTVYDLPKEQRLLVGSYPGEIHVPTIPGLPVSEKKLV